MRLEETNILFIEDDMAACKSLPPILKSYGFKVNTANTFRQAIQEIEANTYGLYLIDINIPGGDGFDLCRIIYAVSLERKKIHRSSSSPE